MHAGSRASFPCRCNARPGQRIATLPGSRCFTAGPSRPIRTARSGSTTCHLPAMRIFPALGDGSPPGAQAAEEVEVGPKTVARVGMPVKWPVTITGRVLDAQTGKGIAGVDVRSSLLSPQNSLQYIGQTLTDAKGRYTIAARPGKLQVQPDTVPKAYLGLRSRECPRLEVTADRTWPDLKLARAAELDGVVVDTAGQPVVGAEVLVTIPDPRGFFSSRPPIRTGPGGTFHLEQLDPDDTLPLRPRTKEATTDGTIVIRPRTVAGKLAAHDRSEVRLPDPRGGDRPLGQGNCRGQG